MSYVNPLIVILISSQLNPYTYDGVYNAPPINPYPNQD